MDGKLIDVCTDYIKKKDCSYLAKEGMVVYYASLTGRKSDYMWHKLTITEALRIIRALKLDAKSASQLKEGHLISAFQEEEKDNSSYTT